MSVEVGGMTWKEMIDMVERRVNRLAMCKRGTLATEINKRIEALGKVPRYTPEEAKAKQEALAPRILKALSPTMALYKKHKGYLRSIQGELYDKADKIRASVSVHPGLAKYNEKVAAIKQEQTERLAQLDGDFQDVIDTFSLKVLPVHELPAELLKLEVREW